MERNTNNKRKNKKDHLLFIDGKTLGNSGLAAWAAIRVLGGEGEDIVELGGALRESTQTRIELIGLIEGSRGLPKGDCTIFTDSTYLSKGATEHARLWVSRGWKTHAWRPIANRELWEVALTLLGGRTKFGRTSWRLIPGHASMRGNERADEIATGFAEYERSGHGQPALFRGKLSDYPIDILNMRFDAALAEKRQRARHRARAKAYSYISLLDGKAKRHSSWEECAKRVRGKAGAKAVKTLSQNDERATLKRWRVTLS